MPKNVKVVLPTNQKLPSKGDRLNWVKMSKLKPVRLTQDLLKGKVVTNLSQVRQSKLLVP
jgi:hypothetical protein